MMPNRSPEAVGVRQPTLLETEGNIVRSIRSERVGAFHVSFAEIEYSDRTQLEIRVAGAASGREIEIVDTIEEGNTIFQLIVDDFRSGRNRNPNKSIARARQKYNSQANKEFRQSR